MTTRRFAKPTGKYDDLAGTREATSAETVEPELPRGAKARGTPGPAPDPDSLRAQVEDGRATHLHVLVPKDLHQRLKMRGVMTERPVSLIVADAIREYPERSEA
jgi:hypothetical protein